MDPWFGLASGPGDSSEGGPPVRAGLAAVAVAWWA